MEIQQEPIIESGICKRCGRKLRLLSNGLCTRCDNVLYGSQKENNTPIWYPKQIPKERYAPTFPSRRQLWCKHD